MLLPSVPRPWVIFCPISFLSCFEFMPDGSKQGMDGHHANMEVWDQRLFEWINPGKARRIGHAEWIKRMLDSVNILGEGDVRPNFVGGIEMAKPYGFATIDEVPEIDERRSRGHDEPRRRSALQSMAPRATIQHRARARAAACSDRVLYPSHEQPLRDLEEVWIAAANQSRLQRDAILVSTTVATTTSLC
jgi:hypothetical protein